MIKISINNLIIVVVLSEIGTKDLRDNTLKKKYSPIVYSTKLLVDLI